MLSGSFQGNVHSDATPFQGRGATLLTRSRASDKGSVARDQAVIPRFTSAGRSPPDRSHPFLSARCLHARAAEDANRERQRLDSLPLFLVLQSPTQERLETVMRREGLIPFCKNRSTHEYLTIIKHWPENAL